MNDIMTKSLEEIFLIYHNKECKKDWNPFSNFHFKQRANIEKKYASTFKGGENFIIELSISSYTLYWLKIKDGFSVSSDVEHKIGTLCVF